MRKCDTKTQPLFWYMEQDGAACVLTNGVSVWTFSKDSELRTVLEDPWRELVKVFGESPTLQATMELADGAQGAPQLKVQINGATKVSVPLHHADIKVSTILSRAVMELDELKLKLRQAGQSLEDTKQRLGLALKAVDDKRTDKDAVQKAIAGSALLILNEKKKQIRGAIESAASQSLATQQTHASSPSQNTDAEQSPVRKKPRVRKEVPVPSAAAAVAAVAAAVAKEVNAPSQSKSAASPTSCAPPAARRELPMLIKEVASLSQTQPQSVTANPPPAWGSTPSSGSAVGETPAVKSWAADSHPSSSASAGTSSNSVQDLLDLL